MRRGRRQVGKDGESRGRTGAPDSTGVGTPAFPARCRVSGTQRGLSQCLRGAWTHQWRTARQDRSPRWGPGEAHALASELGPGSGPGPCPGRRCTRPSDAACHGAGAGAGPTMQARLEHEGHQIGPVPRHCPWRPSRWSPRSCLVGLPQPVLSTPLAHRVTDLKLRARRPCPGVLGPRHSPSDPSDARPVLVCCPVCLPP